MKQCQRKSDPMHGQNSIASSLGAAHLDIVVGPFGEQLDGPVGEHDPREDGVQQEDEGEADSSCDRAVAVA